MTEHGITFEDPLVEEVEVDEGDISFSSPVETFPDDTIPANEETVQTRAVKADIAINTFEGRDEKSRAELADNIRGGGESLLRKDLMAKDREDFRQRKLEFIQNVVIQNKSSRPSEEAVQQFLQLDHADLQDEKMIMESLFAKEIMAGLPSSKASEQEDPVAHNNILQTMTGLLAKKEYLQTKMEHGETLIKERGITQTVQNWVGQYLVPLRERTLLRGALEGVIDESFLKSNFLEEQHTLLMLLEGPEFVRRVDETFDTLWDDNPGVALEWLTLMLTRTADDDFLLDLFDIVDLSIIPDIALGVGFGLARRGVQAGIRGGVGLRQAGIERKKFRAARTRAEGLGFTASRRSPGQPSRPAVNAQPTGPATASFLSSAIDVFRNATRRTTSIEDITAARGAASLAAVIAVARDLRVGLFTRLSSTNSIESTRRLLRDLPTLFVPGRILSNAGRLSNEEKRRITAILHQNSELALRAATQVRLVAGQPEAAIEAGLIETLDKFRSYYKGPASDILNIKNATPDGQDINVLTAAILIGKKGRPFVGATRHTQAKNYAEQVLDLPARTYKIVQEDGDNVFIKVFKPIDVTTTIFRTQLARANPTPLSYRNMLGSLLFGSDEQVSAAFRQNAKVAILAQNNYSAYQKAIFKPVRKGMSPKQRKDMEHYYEVQRVHENFDADGNLVSVGRFDKTIGEFERNFESTIGRYPDANESLGYFTIRQLNDLDLLTNNFGIYRDKARESVERHVLRRQAIVDTLTDQDGLPTLVNTGGIEGKIIDPQDFPYDIQDHRIMFHDPVSAERDGSSLTSLMNSDELSPIQLKARLAQEVEDGAVIIRLNRAGQDVVEKEFSTFLNGDLPDYIVAKRVQTGPIELSQIPNNPGGHNIYPDGSFLKQGRMVGTGTSLRYAGDRAIINLPFHPDAVKLSKVMESIRRLLSVGEGGALRITDEAAFTALVGKTPFDPDDVKGWFRPDRETGESFLSTNVPIVAARSGEKTTDLLDGYKTGVLLDEGLPTARRANVRVRENELDKGVSADFATHRDSPLESAINRGTEDSPAFDVRQSNFIPAFATLQKSLDTIANNRFLDDFKFRAQDQFVEEFGDLLEDVGGINGKVAAARNPTNAALNGKLKTKGVDSARLNAAKNQQRILKQVLRMETEQDRAIRHTFQKVVDGIYEKFGEKPALLLTDNVLATIQDPAKYIRSIAFHTKLGLFNPVQLFLQSQGAVNAVGIVGPKVAWQSAPAATQFMRLGLSNSDAIVREFARRHKRIGDGFAWKEDEFVEAYNAMTAVGWGRVGGEVGTRNVQRADRLLPTRWGIAVDKSPMLFNMGEQFNRTMGYTMSYRRWRNANPTAKFDLAAQDKVLDMADTLAGNMTSFSNAAWQKGFVGVPTQFFAYQARIAEQMLPKFLGGASRITTAEKWRMFATYSTIYGIPVAAGTLTAVIPWYEVVRERQLMAGDQNPDGQSPVTDAILYALHNGIVSTMFKAAGVDVNFAERYGPGGLDYFKDIIDGEKNTLEVLMGVSGSVVHDIYKSFHPLAMSIADAANGDPDIVPMLLEDFKTIATNVSSFNAGTRFWMAINARKYYTRNATLLSDTPVGFVEAAFTSMTGLSRREQADTFLKLKLIRIKKEAQQEIMGEIQKALRRGFMSGTSNEERARWIKRAGHLKTLGELDMRQTKQAFKKGLTKASLKSTIDAKFATVFGRNNPDIIADFKRGQN